MPPPGGGKRKRGDRTYSRDNYNRPSPHRPENLSLAHQSQSYTSGNGRDFAEYRGRGGRRASRGSRETAFNAGPYNTVEPPGARNTSPSAERLNPPASGQIMAQSEAISDESEVSQMAPSLPYEYTFVTDHICESWENGGRQSIWDQASQGIQAVDESKINIILQELSQAVLVGRLDPTSSGGLVKELIHTSSDDDAEISHDEETGMDIRNLLLGSISILCEGATHIPLDRLSRFVIATEISPTLLRQELDASLLEKLDLIRNTYGRMGIRKQTNILYRQANFNLMREESEGFAKLITELFTTSGNEPPTGPVVEATVEKVKAMIGAFDLDVGRSLDVVLDVFGAVLVKQFRFFVKFLRASPWWPRQANNVPHDTKISGLPLWALPGVLEWRLTEEQELYVEQERRTRDELFWTQARTQGLRTYYTIGHAQTVASIGSSSYTSPDDYLTKSWVETTGTLLPLGNRDAAQLLGFKLRFYSSSPARDENDVLPDNLIYLSALLIKIGFISLKDLYPHIWRSDGAMEELRQQKLKEKDERDRAMRPGAGARNALMMAGALVDDTLPIPSRLRETGTRAGTPSKETEPEKSSVIATTVESADQKVLLLKSLLAIGALPEALFILGKFPWLIDLYPDLPEYLHRILHHSLSHVYRQVRPLDGRQSLRSLKPEYETDIPGLPKGQVKIVPMREKKVLRWALLDRNDSSDGTDYRFYWDEWNDNIPVCQTVDDVFTLCDTLLPLVGVKIGQDPSLVVKIARIGKYSLLEDKSEANRARWLDLSKRILLPALSMTKSNAGVVNEVFELLNNYPTSTRYLLYLEWSAGRTSRNPDIKTAFDQAKAETKDILKRISKTNIRPMARALAKVAYANPHIVITTALAQIEVYDSIAEVFVEGARYFTDLGYDVLTWAMISSMARAGRSRTQEGGIFTSRWLSALAQFAGKIYRRYSMMRPGPVLQYVLEQLEHGNSTDLKMLEQIVVSMAGIATDTSYNDAQLQAMGGGPLLQSQTILQLLDRRHDAGIKLTSRRLIKALQENGMAGKFLLLMAQQRQACVFEEGDVPLKAIGNTYDEISRIMMQYLDLLRSNLSTEDFRSTIPGVLQLLVDFEIRPEIAFSISRPLIAKEIVDFDRETSTAQKSEDVSEKGLNGDIEMSDHINESSEEDGEAVENENVNDEAATPNDAELSGANFDLDTGDKPFSPPTSDTIDPWHPVLKEIMDGVEPTLPENIVKVIGAGFYVTFWQLSLYDITIPGKSYEDELSRQNKKIAAISADRTDVSLAGTRKKEAEKKVIGELIDSLLTENKQHLKAFAESKARLQREKDQWFAGRSKMIAELNTALMEHCFLPRILTSPLDAYFCFKFVKFLHGAGTSNFRAVSFYDLLFRAPRIASLIFTCTSKEADHLGKFINEVLKDLTRWHASKATYEREAWGIKKHLPGFAMKVDNGKVVSLLDFESFRRVLYKWHGQIYSALQKCLTSPEYMHIRNAISILRAISAIYPSVNFHGTGLQKFVDKLRDSDKEDLKVASQALLGALHRREKSWIPPQAFRQGQESQSETAVGNLAPKEEDKPKGSRQATPSVVKGDEDGEVNENDIRSSSALQTSMDDKKETGRQTPKPTQQDADDLRKIPTRPPPTNGSSTPRSVNDIPVSDRREVRQPRNEGTRSHGLPRRVSPPPRHQPPASLPSRPEAIDNRNGHRDSPRIPSRPPIESSRPTPDNRLPPSRDSRTNYRTQDAGYEEYDRHARRSERPEMPPHVGRDDRGYGREREVDRPPMAERSRIPDRDRMPERDRQPPRPPPREREGRDRPTRGDLLTPKPSDETQSRTSMTPSNPPDNENVPINPERAAMIVGATESRSSPAIRNQPSDRPVRSSRPSSPRREEERRSHHRSDRDEKRPNERRQEATPSRAPPTASAGPELGQRSGPGNQYPKDSRQSQNHGQIDMQQGRLEQDPSHRPPPQRTERAAEPEVPSGPRGRNTTTPRGRGAPPINTQVSQQPFNERPTPTGPSRHSRNNSYQETSSVNQIPVDTGVHPSRMGQIEPSPTEHSRAPPPLPPPQTSPPAGPRGNAPVNAPSGPSPTTRGPPASPHSDMNNRGGRSNRNPLAAVNNTLSQAGQGTSIRGRGGMRQNSAAFSPHMPPPNPHGPRPEGFPPQQDLFGSQNPNGVPIATRLNSSRPESGRDRRPEGDTRDNDRRSSRRHEEPRDREGYNRNERENRDGKDERESSRREDRSNRRDEQHGDDRRGFRPNQRDDGQTRKHGREESGPYGGMNRGGLRSSNESKRPRRGGS